MDSATVNDQEEMITTLTTSSDMASSIHVTSADAASNDVELSDGPDPVMVASSVIASVGIIANLTVIVVFVNHKHFRQKIPVKFIINQSILDLGVSMMLLLKALLLKDTRVLHSEGVRGDLECRLWNAQNLLWGLFLSSTWNLVSLSFERYLEIVHPMWHKAYFKKRWIYIGFAVNCLFGVTFESIHKIPTTKVVSGVCHVYAFWPSVILSSVFGSVLVIIEYFLPLLILIYCYGRIIWALTQRMDSNIGGTQFQNDIFQIARTNTVITFFLISLCFAICWSGCQTLYLMLNIGYDIDFNSTFLKSAILVAFCNCTINPFVYLIKYKDFQTALEDFLTFCKKRNSEESNNWSNNTSTSNLAMDRKSEANNVT